MSGSSRMGPFAPGTIIDRCDIPHPSMVANVCNPNGWVIAYRVLDAKQMEEMEEDFREATVDKMMSAHGFSVAARPRVRAFLARSRGWL